jgi:hypothetical protein
MPTNEHHVLVCIGVVDVDVDVDELETGVVDQAAPRASGKTPKRWWSCSMRKGCSGSRNAIAGPVEVSTLVAVYVGVVSVYGAGLPG